MNKPSDPRQDGDQLRRKLIGLGEKSLHKSYYPALQERLAQLERFRALLDQSTEAILLVDSDDLRVVDCNQTAGRMLGHPPDRLRGETLPALLECHPSSPLAAWLADPVGAPEGQVEGICHFQDPQGRPIPVEFTTSRVVFADKAYLVLVGRDVGARVEAEKALRKSEARFRLLAENITDVIWVLELSDMSFSYMSPSVRGLQGYSPEEAAGLSLANILTPPSLATAVATLGEELAREGDPQAHPGRTRTMELENLRQDGSTVWVEATCRFMRDTKGRPTAVIGVSRDISERKRVQEQLRQSEEKHRSILEVAPDPMVLYDIQGRVLYFNPAFTRVFGWTLDELIGRKIDYVPPDQWPRTKEMLDVMKQGRVLFGFETSRYDSQGNLLDIALSWSVWRDHRGDPAGSVVVLRDITGKKKLQAQLEQARKMEAIGALAGGVAHDLNNVLQAVSGNVQLMLLKGQMDPASREQLVDMDKLIQRAGETIGQLLTLSRRKAARQEAVDANREIRHVCRLLERVIPRMISLKLSLAPDLRPILGDPAQMEQIVLNLTTNAVDAMPQGGQLNLSSENLELDEMFCRDHPDLSPGPHVLIQVADTGQGMDPKTLEQIFDPFFTTKQAGKGTGLGLATVYTMVKSHQGMVSCYSHPGQGSVFKIFLPALSGPAQDEDRNGSPPMELRGGDETILIVDDEPSILVIGREMLEIHGYHVLQASSGEEALSVCRPRPGGVDLVLLDLNMPGMGGLRCLEQLLLLDPAPKVVISSGYRTEAMARDLAQGGAAGFMDKPYRLNDLILKVREVLDH